MKKKVNIILIMMVFLLGLIACNSNRNILEGKYIGLNTEVYFRFSKDGTYSTNYYDIDGFGEELDDMGITWFDYGTYRIDENKLTLFNGEEESDDIELGSDFGYVYKNMICYKWEGELPLQNQETEVTYENWSIADTIQFNKDNTVEFIYTTPHLKTGILISALTFLLMVCSFRFDWYDKILQNKLVGVVVENIYLFLYFFLLFFIYLVPIVCFFLSYIFYIC